MSADEHVVNRAQGRQAGADDTDADFRHGPNTGFDIGPLADDTCQLSETSIGDEKIVAYRLSRDERGGSGPLRGRGCRRRRWTEWLASLHAALGKGDLQAA